MFDRGEQATSRPNSAEAAQTAKTRTLHSQAGTDGQARRESAGQQRSRHLQDP
jgi:hypothetical protein